MSLGLGSLQTWLDRGTRGGFPGGFLEAAGHFEKAVSIDTQSAKTQFCLSMSRSLSSMREQPPRTVGQIREVRLGGANSRFLHGDDEESGIAKGPEESFTEALRIDPRNKATTAYL